jgi:uncharacterized membrane protein
MTSFGKAKTRFGIRQITIVGMMSAVSVVLGLTGYGFVPLPAAKATIMHIPVIIGAILEGPVVGAVIGLIFGLFSIFQNITTPSLLSFAFINPLVSVLPRILIGITSYYSFRILLKKNEPLSIAIGAAVGTITNTAGVLTMIYILYAARYAEVIGKSADIAAKAIYGIALTNGIPEMIIAILVTVPAVLAIKKIRK